MNSSINIQIGEAIRSYLESKGLLQKEVAERLNITQGAVSAYYRGKPFGKNAAQKWSNLFGFRVNWLLTGEGDMLVTQQDQQEIPTEDKSASGDSLLEYLQRKVAELEGKIEKLTYEKAELLQENAVLKYENMMLAPKGKGAEDVGTSSCANVG